MQYYLRLDVREGKRVVSVLSFEKFGACIPIFTNRFYETIDIELQDIIARCMLGVGIVMVDERSSFNK